MPLVYRPAREQDLERAQELVVRSINESRRIGRERTYGTAPANRAAMPSQNLAAGET